MPAYGSSALCWTLTAFSVSWSFYAVGRTPWTGDQPVARPLPAHRTAQTQNKRTQTSMPRVGFERTIPVFEWAKTIHACPRPRGYCDIFILGTSWRWVIRFTLRPPLPLGKLVVIRFVDYSLYYRLYSWHGNPSDAYQSVSHQRLGPLLQRPNRLWGSPSLVSNGYRGAISLGVKRQGHEAEHSPLSSANVKNGAANLHSHLLLRDVVLN
jgi:hypothetical protein